MTALTMPARPAEDTRPLPWRRMAWVTWRQHRFALTGVAVLLGALAVYVWIVGLQMHHAYAAATACRPVSSPACGELFVGANEMNPVLANGFPLLAVPALIGMFVGAPVLARELETGTFRYAWTQGFGRWRWTLAKLVMLAVAVAAATGAISVLLSWYYQPYFAARNPAMSFSELSPLTQGLFPLRGIAFAAWTLAAFAISALAGMLIRRVVPAMAATLAAYLGLAYAAAVFLREHYLTLVVTDKLNTPVAAWITSEWFTKGGKFAFAGNGLQAFNVFQRLCPVSAPGSKPLVSPELCLAQHGYTLWTSYQPASRFWPFQWIEGGWLLALSMLLIATTIWLVRRRAA